VAFKRLLGCTRIFTASWEAIINRSVGLLILNMTLLLKAGVLNSLHLFSPKKGTSHEETTQNALSMLPMGWGCSVGSLTYHSEKKRLYNTLRLQEADFYSSAILLKSFFRFIMFLSFGLISLSEQRYLNQW
jgi:hypothetical protein